MEEGFSCQMGRAENKIWFCGLDFKCHEVNIIPGREKADLKKLAWCLLPKKFGDLTFEKLKSFLKRGFYFIHYIRGVLIIITKTGWGSRGGEGGNLYKNKYYTLHNNITFALS